VGCWVDLDMIRYILIGLLILSSFTKSNQFINGVDISMLKQVEENGGLFYENGNQIDPIQIFKDKGINTARIKIWHTPSLNYNNLESVLEIADRASSVGLDLFLDFHYSDTWADPSSQTKPSAWVDLNFETLCDSLEQYSHHVITKLKNQNTLPKYVQIGNETDCGFLWPDGYVCDESNNDSQWNKLRELFMHAIEGINSALDTQDTLKIISHVSSGGNWFFNNLIGQGVDIDILSISYYPMWHGTLSDLNQNMDELGNEFQKPVLIVETAYPFTLQWNDNTNNILGLETQLLEDYEASEDGQFTFLHDLIILVDENDYGLGICYWAPDWISTNQFGSPWENQALFDFDGELLDAISVFDNSSVAIKRIDNFSLNNIYNYPNPFNPITTLEYDLPEDAVVNITIYDMMGRVVNTLVNGSQTAGYKSIQWDATNNLGDPVSAGLYIYTIQAGEFRQTKKMILLK
jgi:arabinogalactan endo-1,4-beta-galactosidase|tara:strand:- start:227 stop:1615 length:1389 start_codon:yes stop_codon:yes gene_type:complete